jgi:hypothetical protein
MYTLVPAIVGDRSRILEISRILCSVFFTTLASASADVGSHSSGEDDDRYGGLNSMAGLFVILPALDDINSDTINTMMGMENLSQDVHELGDRHLVNCLTVRARLPLSLVLMRRHRPTLEPLINRNVPFRSQGLLEHIALAFQCLISPPQK